jgi:hypothetical protein
MKGAFAREKPDVGRVEREEVELPSAALGVSMLQRIESKRVRLTNRLGSPAGPDRGRPILGVGVESGDLSDHE